MESQATLILASTSPRRQEILTALGLTFVVAVVDVDERRLPHETAEQMVLRLALAKAEAAASAHFVIGADTAVIAGDKIFGKPQDQEEAVAMLLSLAGRGHCVLTGVALLGPQGVQTALSATEVYFREISRDEAVAYWQSGEPRDKAGAYGIQGLGGIFVERIEGSYSGVVGLPIYETTQLLQNAGIGVLTKQTDHDG
ncbi:MAG: Maf family protein [Woeseiaceae bacterium]